MIRPMLAVEAAPEVDLAEMGKSSFIQFPCIAQVKFDGFRTLILNGGPVTRTLKPVPNDHVRQQLSTVFGEYGAERGNLVHQVNHPLEGLDGELVAVDVMTMEEESLHVTQSRINSVNGFPRFVFHVFDDFSKPGLPYIERIKRVEDRVTAIRNATPNAFLETDPSRIGKKIHSHTFQFPESRICERIEDLLEFEAECLAWGAEGIMLKRIDGKYKFGRSTLREGLCLKVKRFTDSEAKIIGFIEKMNNNNAAEIDERGYTKRSSARANLSPAGTLGSLVLDWDGIEFEIGTGWDAATAQEIWDNQSKFIGMTVNFKYKGIGPNGKPLIPSFQGVRYDV